MNSGMKPIASVAFLKYHTPVCFFLKGIFSKMDRSGFPPSSAHRAREQDMCTSTPNDILHDSAARAKYTLEQFTAY